MRIITTRGSGGVYRVILGRFSTGVTPVRLSFSLSFSFEVLHGDRVQTKNGKNAGVYMVTVESAQTLRASAVVNYQLCV